MKNLVNFESHYILILLAMIPSFIIAFIIYKRDKIEKEPILLLIKLFIFGILSSGVALFFEIYLEKLLPFLDNNDNFDIIVRSFFLVALVEEFVKWFFMYVFCWTKEDFNYTYDSIVYAVFVSLGFATVENIVAALANNNNVLLLIKRSLLTVPAHAFFAISSGYYFGLAKKFDSRNWIKRKNKYLALSILVPILIHGLFDSLLLLYDKVPLILIIAFAIYLLISSVSKVIYVSKNSKKIKDTNW